MHGGAEHAVVVAVGLRTVRHEVPPRDALRVQQVREVGPGVRSGVFGMRAVPVTRDVGGQRKIGLAAHRVIRDSTARGPSRDHVEVRGEAPRTHAFEQVILQHEAVGVRPVVGDLTSVVPADDIGSRATVRHGDAVRCHVTPAMFSGTGDRSPDEPRHAVAIDVEERIAIGVEVRRCRRASDRGTAARIARDAGRGRRPTVGHRSSGSRRLPDRCRNSCRTTGSPASRRSRAGSCGCPSGPTHARPGPRRVQARRARASRRERP